MLQCVYGLQILVKMCTDDHIFQRKLISRKHCYMTKVRSRILMTIRQVRPRFTVRALTKYFELKIRAVERGICPIATSIMNELFV